MFCTMCFYALCCRNLKTWPVTVILNTASIHSFKMNHTGAKNRKKEKKRPPKRLVTLLHCWEAFWFNLFSSVIYIWFSSSSLSCSVFPVAVAHLIDTSLWRKCVVSDHPAAPCIMLFLSLWRGCTLAVQHQGADCSWLDLVHQLREVRWLGGDGNFSRKFLTSVAQHFPPSTMIRFWHFYDTCAKTGTSLFILIYLYLLGTEFNIIRGLNF